MTDWNSAPKMAGRNPAPVEGAAIEQKLPHVPIKSGGVQTLGEQAAVDIGEGGKLFVERF